MKPRKKPRGVYTTRDLKDQLLALSHRFLLSGEHRGDATLVLTAERLCDVSRELSAAREAVATARNARKAARVVA